MPVTANLYDFGGAVFVLLGIFFLGYSFVFNALAIIVETVVLQVMHYDSFWNSLVSVTIMNLVSGVAGFLFLILVFVMNEQDADAAVFLFLCPGYFVSVGIEGSVLQWIQKSRYPKHSNGRIWEMVLFANFLSYLCLMILWVGLYLFSAS